MVRLIWLYRESNRDWQFLPVTVAGQLLPWPSPASAWRNGSADQASRLCLAAFATAFESLDCLGLGQKYSALCAKSCWLCPAQR